MRTRLLLRALWTHHKKACVLALALVVGLAATPFALCGSSDDAAAVDEAGERPYLILDRVWFDRYPDDARTDLSLFVWLSSGVGVYQRGSAYRATFELFEFERNGRALRMTFLQDDERAQTRFEVTRCDAAPFDLCLTLDDAVRGPRRYYGFSDQAAQAEHAPWASDALARARRPSP